MPYLIDGHNLIPKLGMKLEFIDDEMMLIARLKEFCRLNRVKVEVYFDGAPAGQASVSKYGAVEAHFIRKRSSADAAIEVRLAKMGRSAKNWTVVSSDQRVRLAAGAVQAKILSSEEFSKLLKRTETMPACENGSGPTLKPDEVEEWLKIFEKRGR
jgi:predicted RNA-binding protein with PIN domain